MSKTGNIFGGAAQGGMSGAATGSAFGPLGAAIGGVAGAGLGALLGASADDDTRSAEEILNQQLSNKGLQLSIEEKKLALEQIKRQQAQRKKMSTFNSNYMNNFFAGTKMVAPSGPSTPISTAPSAAQRLAGTV